MYIGQLHHIACSDLLRPKAVSLKAQLVLAQHMHGKLSLHSRDSC